MALLLLYIIISLFYYVLSGVPAFIAINIITSVQDNDGGFLPGIILLTQCYYHRGTCLNAYDPT